MPNDYAGERFDPVHANALAHYDHHARYHFVRRNFGGGHLLDVGCGLGIGSVAMSTAFARVTGIDASEEAVLEAKRRSPDGRLDFRTVEEFERARNGPVFDVVTCLEVIEHTVRQQDLAELVRRHVSPSGVAVFSTPNLNYSVSHQINNPFHVKELTGEDFFALLEGVFPHVERLAMVQHTGASVLSVDALPQSSAVAWSAPRGEDVAPPDAATTNFLAVCSFVPRAASAPVVLADAWTTFVDELREVSAAQTRMIDERDALIRKQDELVALLRARATAAELALNEARQPAEPPLRHRIVDALNSALKRTPIHTLMKHIAGQFSQK
jgi:ubiquinone/menaquinone biosynthesis C-methylase UbiE